MSESLDPHGFPKPQDDFSVQQNPFVSPVAEESRGEGLVTQVDEPLNPWVSMWLRARATVRQQLDTDPTRYVLLLAILGGISGAYDDADFAHDELAMRISMFVGYAIGGAIAGIIWLFLYGWLTGVTGRSLGGVANAAQVRTALAWSNIPSIWMLPVTAGLALVLAIFGPNRVFGEMFVGQQDAGGLEFFSALPPWLWGLAALGVIVMIWQIVITCQAVGEAHEFSSMRGFGALLLAGLAIVGIGMAVAFAVIFALAATGLFPFP